MFITFEGVDGAGKTTIINRLADYLQAKGISLIVTREPGTSHSRVSQKIRKIILDPRNTVPPMVEALLYSADRRLHLEQVIWPALQAKQVVLCDRYIDSTLAYQGAARELDIQKMLTMQTIVTNGTMPDLTFYFDINPDVSVSRVGSRIGRKDRLEKEGFALMQKVREGYLQIVSLFPERIRVINASLTRDEVFNQVQNIIDKFF